MPSPYEFSHPFDKTELGKAAVEDRMRRIARQVAVSRHILDADGDLFPEYEANAWADMSAEEWAQRCTESTDSGARP